MNPRFEEHQGQLFRMLDEPVQLKEKNTNVLVQFITHGVIGEYVMEHWLDCGQENAPIFVDSVDSDGDVIVCFENGNKYGCPFPMFEIIGYPVEEGSRWWALYQMMQGKKVCNPTLAAEKATRLGFYEVEQFNTFWYIVGDAVVEGKSNYGTLSVSSWIAASSSTGWQVYKEAETDKEPIADCDNCKHRCTKSNIDYCQMYEPKPEPQYKVGDWVECNGNQRLIEVIGRDLGRGNYYHFAHGFGGAYANSITRKLSPSEIIVKIGCLEGKVEDLSYADNGRFFLIGKATERHPVGMYSILYDEMLDSTTRELVESLLKAQEEK